MNQPRVMQYVNETVVEVNVPAVVSKLHVRSKGHDSVLTHVHSILFFPLSLNALSQEERGEMWIESLF